jgi:CDP-glycerol glycerophosphotransferase
MPARFEGLRYRLIERDAYVMLRSLDLVTRGVRGLQRRVRRPGKPKHRRVRQVLGQAYYMVQRLLPVDESLALYAAYWYRGVTCNPAAIAAKAAELAPHIRPVWVVGPARAHLVPPGTDHVVAGTMAYFRALARARYLVNNVNWPNRMVKRRGTTHVMTHHGTPLKMMGMDQLGHPAAAADVDFAGQMRRADRWDFSVTANAHTTIAWSRAYPCDYETLEVGYPRNDRLATATPDEVAAVRAELGIPAGRRVVLYMPTFREWLPAGTQVLEVERLAEALGPDTVLLVRAHYFNVPATTAGERAGTGRLVDVSGHPVVEDLYLAADILLTDYSSAMFDYAVLDRPIVIFAPDWDVYRDLRGVYFDLMETPPGPIARNYPELVEIFRSGVYRDDVRGSFRDRFAYLDDGHAAERVVRRVFLDDQA